MGVTHLSSLTLSGDLIVGGTETITGGVTYSGNVTLGDTSGDAITINGTTTALAPVTVGVDDTGHDVKFFGATSGKSWLWDESADKMIVTGDASVSGLLTTGNVDLGVGGTAALSLKSDLKYAAGFGVIGSASNAFAPIVIATAQETISAGTGGAISVAAHMSDISTDAGGDAFTLASGADQGQLKYILLTTDGGGDAVITATFSTGNNTLTMADAGDYALLLWNGAAWAPIELGNRVDGVTKPVLSTV